MLLVKPDFYDEFHCIASRCRHSCCVGWEIDVDEDSLAYYQSVPGEMGELLRGNIELRPTPHFRLSDGERCPFLRPDGLCRMILELGEDSLCDICAEHPRFYNEFPGRLEAGLGLCCEEAARLLLRREGHLRLVAEGEAEEWDDLLLALRGEIFALLAEDDLPLTRRMEAALARMGQHLIPFRRGEAAHFFLTLERMDESWTALLERLGEAPDGEPGLSDERFARIAEYLIYRHFASAANEEEAAQRLQFCFYAARLVCALGELAPVEEALRLFSAEIEYSDENVGKICEWLGGAVS